MVNLLNEIKLHREFIIEVPYMNSRKFRELLIANVNNFLSNVILSENKVESYLLKSKVFNMIYKILDGVTKEGNLWLKQFM